MSGGGPGVAQFVLPNPQLPPSNLDCTGLNYSGSVFALMLVTLWNDAWDTHAAISKNT